jgi:uncharacterized protein
VSERSGTRDPFVDSLRAAALFGVVIVNVAGYAYFPDSGHIVPPPAPPDSRAAIATQWLIMTLLQGKAYPLLAFLFGLSFTLSMRQRSDDALAHRRRRMRRLLTLGLAHGLLLYAGDVLTVYAVAGFVLLGSARLRTARLLGRLRVWVVVATVCIGAQVAILHLIGAAMGSSDPRTYASAGSWFDFVSLSASRFMMFTIGLPLLLPQIVALMMAGMVAGRLRLLTHPRWRPAARRWAMLALPSGLMLNVGLTWATWPSGSAFEAPPSPWTALFGLVGPVLSVGFVATAMTRPTWLARLAPAGRLTLTMYLATSLAMAICLAGPGLGWALGSVGTLGFGIALYAVLLVTAIAAGRVGWRAPMERWLAR